MAETAHDRSGAGAGTTEPIRSGSEAEAGAYACTNCGYRLATEAPRRLPPCPECLNGKWRPKLPGALPRVS